ncbi:hypothetical protein KKB18_03955, partial [bacterium]|nr:hypothetical protein [bacterium]
PREYFRSELAAIQMIPNNANVSAPVSMISRLGHRVHLIPSMLPDKIAGFDEGKEYILLDEHFPSKDFDYKKQIHDMINSDSTEIANYDLIYNKEGIYLFRKK